jgi:hypothetical protein
MDDPSPSGSESRTVEVVVFRHGAEIHRELCESTESAALVVDEWSEQEGVQCQVDDLSVHHRPDQILEPTPDEFEADEFEADEYREDPGL